MARSRSYSSCGQYPHAVGEQTHRLTSELCAWKAQHWQLYTAAVHMLSRVLCSHCNTDRSVQGLMNCCRGMVRLGEIYTDCSRTVQANHQKPWDARHLGL
jgi:hypothetical protein